MVEAPPLVADVVVVFPHGGRGGEGPRGGDGARPVGGPTLLVHAVKLLAEPHQNVVVGAEARVARFWVFHRLRSFESHFPLLAPRVHVHGVEKGSAAGAVPRHEVDEVAAPAAVAVGDEVGGHGQSSGAELPRQLAPPHRHHPVRPAVLGVASRSGAVHQRSVAVECAPAHNLPQVAESGGHGAGVRPQQVGALVSGARLGAVGRERVDVRVVAQSGGAACGGGHVQHPPPVLPRQEGRAKHARPRRVQRLQPHVVRGRPARDVHAVDVGKRVVAFGGGGHVHFAVCVSDNPRSSIACKRERPQLVRHILLQGLRLPHSSFVNEWTREHAVRPAVAGTLRLGPSRLPLKCIIRVLAMSPLPDKGTQQYRERGYQCPHPHRLLLDFFLVKPRL
mmetsp:Transcript_12196/g.24753  ORF Transcript_12196/g.24753 Transcript_12196/m.24753 type:complete len:392 (-) Transcript_12196:3-1178(-)